MIKNFISHLTYENNCQKYNISYAKINLENLIFETLNLKAVVKTLMLEE